MTDHEPLARELLSAIALGDDEKLSRILRSSHPAKLFLRQDGPNRLGALALAVEFSRASMVSSLLNAGAHPDGLDPVWGVGTPLAYCASPLYVAASRGDADCAQLLIDAGASVSSVPVACYSGDSWLFPTFAAVKNDRPDVLDLLLKAGADPNLVGVGESCDGSSVLLNVALGQSASADVVKLLLRVGASVFCVEHESGATPFMLAAKARSANVMSMLIGAARVQLGETLLGGTLVDLLDAQDRGGRTALHWAVNERSDECVKLLVAAGASFDIPDDNGFVATRLPHAELLRTLASERVLSDVFSQPSAPSSVFTGRRGLSI